MAQRNSETPLASPPTPELAAFRFSAAGLPGDEAFEAWRQIMARMFHIDRTRVVSCLPHGGLSAFRLGDIMANRSIFNAQHLARDRRRVDATPDHLLLQFYRSGGFVGEMSGGPTRISRGQIAICDLRRPVDVQAVTSDTVGLTLPRHLLDGVDLDRLPPRLERTRERLLAARMTSLHHRMPTMAQSEIAAVTADLVTVLRRLFDPSVTVDVLDAQELDADLLSLAEQLIAGALAEPDLSPATIAAQLHVRARRSIASSSLSAASCGTSGRCGWRRSGRRSTNRRSRGRWRGSPPITASRPPAISAAASAPGSARRRAIGAGRRP